MEKRAVPRSTRTATSGGVCSHDIPNDCCEEMKSLENNIAAHCTRVLRNSAPRTDLKKFFIASLMGVKNLWERGSVEFGGRR